MTKVSKDIRLLPGSPTLFEYAAANYPFEDYIKPFNEQLAKAIPHLFIESKLQELKKTYSYNTDSNAYFGYHLRIEGRDYSTDNLAIGFIFWKEKNTRIVRTVYKLENNIELSAEDEEPYLIRQFLAEFCMGINDALFIVHLESLQNPDKTPKKITHREHILVIKYQAMAGKRAEYSRQIDSQGKSDKLYKAWLSTSPVHKTFRPTTIVEFDNVINYLSTEPVTQNLAILEKNSSFR